MSSFKAVLVREPAPGTNPQAEFGEMTEADWMDGDVTVRVLNSSVNYKDGLVVTGDRPVVRRFPMVPGIDGAGIVEHSDSAGFTPGDRVLITGFGIGEAHLGAWAQRQRWKSDWLIPIPAGFTPAEVMAIGTAGFTAMLCVMALERHDIRPAAGPVLVTGANGGVGSVAIALLARLGYHVVASTGRMEEEPFLKSLGAAEVIDRRELEGEGKPLARERWIGAIDVVGGRTLANILSMIRYDGAVACCGLAGSLDLPASVAPFILRNVTLYGIDSVYAPKSVRIAAWDRLDRDLDRDKLHALTRIVPFGDALQVGRDILAGKVRGRTVLDIGNY